MRKEAHEGISTDFANDFPRLFVRLDLTRGTLCRVLFDIALACLPGLGALYVVSIRRCVGKLVKDVLRSRPPFHCRVQTKELTSGQQ
jgi:hypothetical protein